MVNSAGEWYPFGLDDVKSDWCPYLHEMTAIEKKILDLFTPLPFSFKARVVALLSKYLADEAGTQEDEFVEEDIQTSRAVRNAIVKGEMKLLSEEEYWNQAKRK